MTESWIGQTLRRYAVYNSLGSYPLSSILYLIGMRIPATQFRRFIFRRRKLSSIRAVALGVSCVALAFLVRFLLTPFTVADSAFATFYPAILFSALVGGGVAGVAAIVLSLLAGWWAFVEPIYAFSQPNFREIVHLGLFILSSGVIVWLALQYRRTVFELEDSESQRRLLADEVRHRAKNTVSVILAIVAQTINDKELAHTLSDRIRASVDARDPLETDPSQSTDLRELLVDTVQRTHGQNIVLNGPAVRLGEAQARNLRLVFHEMSTNAAKYGALSEPAGKVNVSWSIAQSWLNILWCEHNGPKVAPPEKKNFGSKLMARMVNDLDGHLEPTFGESGYCYKISVPISDC